MVTILEEEKKLPLQEWLIETPAWTQVEWWLEFWSAFEDQSTEDQQTAETVTKWFEGLVEEEPAPEIKGQDFVVDIDEEKAAPVEPITLTRDSLVDILAKDKTTLTEEEKSLKGKFNARRALGESVESIFWETREETQQAQWLVTTEEARSQAQELIWFDDNTVRIKLQEQWFTPTQIEQIVNEKNVLATSERLETETGDIVQQREQQLEAMFQDQSRELQEQSERKQQLLQSQRSARGFWRSSATEEDILEIQEATDVLINTQKEKFDLEKDLFRAQQEWATAETISAIQKNLSTVNKNLAEQEAISIKATQEINDKLKLSREDALNNLLDWLTAETKSEFNKKGFDFEKSKEVWYFADKDWDVILDKNWKPVVYKVPENLKDADKDPNLQFIPAKADILWNIIQPSWYFNKWTWTFQPINNWWQTWVSEFTTTTEQWIISPVAEYTQVYKWSKFNPEWIDLAWKKWSAINTPVSWEVIFAWDWWKWWNQVKIKDSQWRVHQFSHLDGAIVEVWQTVTPWTMLWTMWNTWQVLKWDWSTPTKEELVAGRWTHLDYTVFDNSWKKMPLDVAMAFAWVDNTSWSTSETSEAIEKWYDSPNLLKIFKQIKKEWWTPANLRDLEKQEKPLTEWQWKSVAFGSRMSKSLKTIESLIDDIKEISPLRLRAIRAWIVPNELLSSTEQQFLQAESDFLKASLRKESWAAIPPEEEASFQRTFGIQPWDSDAVIEQKLESMSTQLESMIKTAWKKWAEDIKSIIWEENIPDWIDDQDLEFFWWTIKDQEDTDIELDQEDQDFFKWL
jgi:hypothetical protein